MSGLQGGAWRGGVCQQSRRFNVRAWIRGRRLLGRFAARAPPRRLHLVKEISTINGHVNQPRPYIRQRRSPDCARQGKHRAYVLHHQGWDERGEVNHQRDSDSPIPSRQDRGVVALVGPPATEEQDHENVSLKRDQGRRKRRHEGGRKGTR